METVFNKDIIREPALWQLYLGISPDNVEIMAYCPLEDHSLIKASVALDKAATDITGAIEEAVYSNPLLLSDFKRVSVVYRTDRFTIIPDALTGSRAADEVTAMYLPGLSGSDTVFDNVLPGNAAFLRCAIPATLYNFIMRTFNCPKLYHNLTPLCTYFNGNSSMGNARKTFVNLRRDSFDIVVPGNGTLSMANTFSFRESLDAVYFILACREMLGEGIAGEELMLCGDREMRDTLTPELRKYVPYVMPVIFPSAMFKAGGQTAMDVAFDLIVLPLCE